MPIFAGLIASSLAWFIAYFGAQITTRLALLAGMMAITAAAYVTLKVAIFALITGLAWVTPPDVVLGIRYILPTNLAGCLTAIFISDAIYEAAGFWANQKQMVSLALIRA